MSAEEQRKLRQAMDSVRRDYGGDELVNYESQCAVLRTCPDQTKVLGLIAQHLGGQSWHVFDWDNPTTWPRKVGRYIVATAWPDEDNEGEIDRDWDRDTWWCYFGADKPPVGHWQEFQSEAVTHWMPISVPEPPAPVSKDGE